MHKANNVPSSAGMISNIQSEQKSSSKSDAASVNNNLYQTQAQHTQGRLAEFSQTCVPGISPLDLDR